MKSRPEVDWEQEQSKGQIIKECEGSIRDEGSVGYLDSGDGFICVYM